MKKTFEIENMHGVNVPYSNIEIEYDIASVQEKNNYHLSVENKIPDINMKIVCDLSETALKKLVFEGLMALSFKERFVKYDDEITKKIEKIKSPSEAILEEAIKKIREQIKDEE